MLVPLNNFAPDLDPTTPGVIVDCDNLLPTLKGYKAQPSPLGIGLPALTSACRGLTVVRDLDATWRVFAATATRIYEATGTAWTDVSKTGGYSATGDDMRWRFAQFGNATLATNRTDPMQQATTGNFADIPTAPKAAIVETVNGFAMAFDTTDATYGDRPDGWWCSALRDQSNWTPSIATQAANGRLLDSPGSVRAGRRLGSDIVAYKERSMYLGRYVGAPVIWSWTLVPGEIGALSQEAVVDIGTAHVFLGVDDFYMFDGTRPVSIGSPLREWFFADMEPRFRYRVQSLHDRINGLVYWFYPSRGGNGALTKWVAYQYKANKWGHGTLTVEAASEYLSGEISYDALGDYFATYDAIPAIAYDSPYWNEASIIASIVDSAHTFKTLLGPGSACSLTTGDLGDDETFTTLTRVRPRFVTAPASATMDHLTHDQLGTTPTPVESSTLNAGKFDAMWSSRWHRIRMNTTGDMEITALTAQFAEDGAE